MQEQYKAEKDKIIDKYNERINEHGCSIQALASGSEKRRTIRFDTLMAVGNMSGKKILDIGCGFGDFYAYLQNRGIECDYTGFDINPNVIEMAKQQFPEADFKVLDVVSEDFPEFDYIVSTSSFNNKFDSVDNYAFVANLLGILYQHAREGVAVDFLNNYCDYQHDHAFYYEPEKLLSISKTITRRVCIRNDYPLFEFMIYLYRDIIFPYGKNRGT